MTEAAETAGKTIEQTLEGSLLVAKSIMANAHAVKEEKIDRAAFLEIHKQLLLANPYLLGTWSGWEPNALDGADASYANSKGHDATGRFVPYWYRTKTGIDLTPLLEYDKEGAGDYYQVAKKRQKESVLEPYVYNVDGVDVLMTSFAVPIIRNGEFLGVAGVDYSLDDLQKEIQALKPMDAGRVGLISSAGTWVVGLTEEATGKPVKDTEPELMAMMGADARVTKQVDLQAIGDKALVIMTPVSIGKTDQNWYVVVEVPVSVMMSPLEKLSNILLLLGALAAVAMGVVCSGVVTVLLRTPLRQIIHAITQISLNNFNVRLPAAKREDDIGTLAKAIEDYRDGRANEVNAHEEKERQHQREKETEDRRKAELQELGQRFSVVVGGGDGEGAHASGGQPNFSTVAASTNEMFEAINSIARQMSQVQDTVNRAVSEFGTVESDFNVLKESSEKINEVIGFIGEIASRTNLLSLNASIEAARAGEAGRGFSIVAEEVKNLAGLTTKATDSIAEQVQGVQEAIKRSVGSIQNISATVAQINQSNMTVAAAVEEQTNTTKEISSSVQYIKGQATDLLEHIRKG